MLKLYCRRSGALCRVQKERASDNFKWGVIGHKFKTRKVEFECTGNPTGKMYCGMGVKTVSPWKELFEPAMRGVFMEESKRYYL